MATTAPINKAHVDDFILKLEEKLTCIGKNKDFVKLKFSKWSWSS